VAVKNSEPSMNGAGLVPRVPAGTGDVPSMDLSDSQVSVSVSVSVSVFVSVSVSVCVSLCVCVCRHG